MKKEDIIGNVILELNLYESKQRTRSQFLENIEKMIMDGVTPPKHLFTYLGTCKDEQLIEQYLVGKISLPAHMKEVDMDNGTKAIARKSATKEDLQKGENVYCIYGDKLAFV